ncbi:MAG: hypothetical protein SFW67_09820 [Myxococcaceae bacterium]|nr:hypothetical protein [Myxococcaceae bacterium]
MGYLLRGLVVVVLVGCGGPPPGPGPMPVRDAGAPGDGGLSLDGGQDGGSSDAGLLDAGDGGASDDAGVVVVVGADGGWRVEAVAGTMCARGAAAGLGYNAGVSDELLIFVQGGGACWNNGTCAPSVYQWGPVCNYGMDSICLADLPGGTRPLAVYVDHPNPFPFDGGGAWNQELGTVRSSIFFTRRPENPMANATYAFVPYCTGDLHAGASTKTWLVKGGLFDMPQRRNHEFAGAANMDAYLTFLRQRHPSVRVIWLVGVSGGGYGAQLNLHRVRRLFPEAQVHVLADSAPMLTTPHFSAWQSAWNLQVPTVCTGCDAGLPAIFEQQVRDAPTSRVGLLSFAEDEVITRFFFSGADTGSWLTPPTGAYVQALGRLETAYEPLLNAKYFRLPGKEHVMLQRAGVVMANGAVSMSAVSPDGGVTLKAWVDAWATGTGPWASQR